MSAVAEQTIHEVDFCSQMASAANVVFYRDPAAFPFSEARVEGFGVGPAKRKRKDLRLFDSHGNIALCGEVKLPGTREGRSPYAAEMTADAEAKANNAAVQYFFTWNVNEFVLWDRSQWHKAPLERRVKAWRLGLTLTRPEEVARPENLAFIKTRFLPDLLRDLADIYTGRKRDWSMPPDDLFIRSLESHLDWPVQLTTAYLIDRCDRNKRFDENVQRWLAAQVGVVTRNNEDEWRKALGNMAKTLAYVWANRLIFYKALRTRFPELPPIVLKRTVKDAEDATRVFARFFQEAVERSGDYESLLFPEAQDWAAKLVFDPPNAVDAWRGLLRGIDDVNFRDVPSDVVGRIFQKLIGPEERHRYGQHFTADDVVDLVNAFCIRSGADAVLDPACGSGSFLVRAYYRKHHLEPTRKHVDLLGELFGCDIAVYPAHLATLNLAAREINDEANYPRIARRDFFDTDPGQPFCAIPAPGDPHQPVLLPALDAVVGNPPYVRQEKIDKVDKVRYAARASGGWNGFRLSGRADLHCYFWPAAAKLLKPGAYFGFLTSSSWLDVEYGFALQGWTLQHFKLVAIMENAAEPWFTGARVKTVVTILQRCADQSARMQNLVRFVRFDRPLREFLGEPAGTNEQARQTAIERLRDRILSTTDYTHADGLRIIIKRQADLWNDGVRAGQILKDAEPDIADEDTADADTDSSNGEMPWGASGEYVAGKWGRYVRAPDFYFEVMRRFGERFVALGELATVRFGVKTGCDAFFMPSDVTDEMLRQYVSDLAFRQAAGGAPRKDVVSGKLRIVEAGDGSRHAIEAEFLAPEVHSLMKVDRPIVRARDVDRVVLLIGKHRKALRGAWAERYLQYGEQQTFASKKSKAVPVPLRSTCAARDPWYDLTGLVRPGFAFWPMAQQYRHIIAANPERLVCNHNLFDLDSSDLKRREQQALHAILNSTLVALFKTFYGRFAGTEGNLKTEVVDVNLIEVPDARGISRELAAKLTAALKPMCKREVGRLVEEQLMECHDPDRARRIAAGPLARANELQQPDRRALDDAVFELLGVSDPVERTRLVSELHEATARHFRAIRVVEIEKMEQRSRSGSRRFSVAELAADAWDAAALAEVTPLREWLKQQPQCTAAVDIPDERPVILSPSPMFDPNTVYFGRDRKTHLDCGSKEQAQLIVRVASLGLSDWVTIPPDHTGASAVLASLDARLQKARNRFSELAESRTSDPQLQSEIVEQLVRWYAHGREALSRRSQPSNAEFSPGT